MVNFELSNGSLFGKLDKRESIIEVYVRGYIIPTSKQV